MDQALVVFAITHPEPNLNLLDRFLVMMGIQGVPVTICFNKVDLGRPGLWISTAPFTRGQGMKSTLSVPTRIRGLEEMRKISQRKNLGPGGTFRRRKILTD